MATLNPIITCLAFDDEAEEAAKFYTAIFPDSKITGLSYYTEAGQEMHRRKPGSVLTVEFEILGGNKFVGLNGGPKDPFNQAISFQVICDTQQEIDLYWEKLTSDGGKPIQCSWLTDKYGVSWQVVPRLMLQVLKDSQSPGSKRAMAAMMQMVKLDIAELERAYRG